MAYGYNGNSYKVQYEYVDSNNSKRTASTVIVAESIAKAAALAASELATTPPGQNFVPIPPANATGITIYSVTRVESVQGVDVVDDNA